MSRANLQKKGDTRQNLHYPFEFSLLFLIYSNLHETYILKILPANGIRITTSPKTSITAVVMT